MLLYLECLLVHAKVLCRCDQVNQDLFGFDRLAHKQMTQISGMAQTMVEWDFLRCEEIKRCKKDFAEILIHNLAVRYCYNIIKAASLVHSKCKRSVLISISEGEFHLVAVLLHAWASLDSEKFILARISDRICHHSADLILL